jgi:exopolysaccharide biosynthesis polyprenyl glycosylphosphotransferase
MTTSELVPPAIVERLQETFLSTEQAPHRGGALAVKRALDVVGSVLGLIVLAPLFLGIAVLIKATSRGPVFYRQDRVGKDGPIFRILKFRTMTSGADAHVEKLMTANGGYAPFYKLREDPRVTRVGKWLRRSSLDELPQLVNVLRGEMSLVGPRPQVRAEVAQYEPEHHTRLRVKPGITGLWQVSGRSDIPWREAMHLDVHYVESWSLAADLRILLKTPKAVTHWRRGAY